MKKLFNNQIFLFWLFAPIVILTIWGIALRTLRADPIQGQMGIASWDTSISPNRFTWLRGDATNGLLVNLGTNNDVTQASIAIGELGVTELIGINEQVSASQYSASVAISLTGTGFITHVCLIATEDDGGVVFTPAGDLIIFDADPAISSNDATITNTERLTILNIMTFATADWQSDANGASNCQDTNEAYHTATLFGAWHSATGETQWNSAAGDDEQLEVNIWFERKT